MSKAISQKTTKNGETQNHAESILIFFFTFMGLTIGSYLGSLFLPFS